MSYLNDLVVFPTFFSLSLNFSIKSSWSEPQLALGFFVFVFAFFCLYRASPSSAADFGIDHLVRSTCRVVSCVVGKGYFLWPVCSLDKTLLAFALLHFVLQGQTCQLLQVFLDLLLLHSNPTSCWVFLVFFFLVLVLEGHVGLHRTVQLWLLWHYRLGHRCGSLLCWIICLENQARSFCHFWVCTQVLHFGLLCWLWELPHFF